MAAGSTYTPLATQTLGSAAASVTFSSISGSYTDLVLVINGGNSIGTNLSLQFNSDTGSNYSSTRLQGNGSTASSTRYSSQVEMIGPQVSTSNDNVIIANIMNYSNATTYKSVLMRGNDASGVVNAYVGLWRSTAAITSVKIITYTNSYTINSGSTLTLYGIVAA
jgi:hypothetical protein